MIKPRRVWLILMLAMIGAGVAAIGGPWLIRTLDRRPAIVCLGDSVTWGHRFSSFRWTGHLQDLIDRHHGGKYRVVNLGVNGATSTDGLYYAARALELQPAIVLIQYGFNDANVYPWTHQPRVSVSEYERNIRELRRLFTDRGVVCLLVINHRIEDWHNPQGNAARYVENYRPYAATMRRLAQERPTRPIDLPGLMEARGIQPAALVRNDGLHLSRRGNRIYAELIHQGLVDALGEDF